VAFGNLLEFAMVLKAVDQASAVLKSVEERVEQLNTAVKDTSKFREAGQNLAIAGASIAAIGAGGALALRSAIEPAIELDAAQRHLLTALPAGAEGMRQLAQATEAAEKASVAFNVSQEDVLQNVYLGVSAGLDFKAALANATASIQVAKGTMGDAAEVGRVLGQIYNDFGNKAAAATPQINHFADVTAYAVRQFAFKNIGEFNEAISESIGAAKAAGIDFETLTAAIAGFQKVGLKGSQAGTALTEALQAIARGGFEKLGVPLARFNNGAIDLIGTLQNFKKAMGDGVVTAEQFQRVSKALGIRGSRLLTLDPAQLKQMHDLLTGSQTAGAAAQGAGIVLGGAGEQLGRLAQAWTQLKEAFGTPMLGALNGIAAGLTPIVVGIGEFVKAHPMLTKFVVTFVAIGSALAILAGAIIGAVGGFLLMASFAPALGGIVATVGVVIAGIAAVGAAIVAFGPAVLGAIEHPIVTMKAAFNGILAFLKSWGPGIAAVLLIAFTGPIGMAIVAVVKFRAQILAALSGVLPGVKAALDAVLRFIESWGAGLFDAGAHLLKTLADGMMSALHWPIDAIKAVAEKVRAYLPFSPAKEGPLAELHRVRIVETIAQQIRPGPIAAAMRTAAAAAAIAVPMVIAPSVARAAVPVAEAGWFAASLPSPPPSPWSGRGERIVAPAGGGLVVNYSPVIRVEMADAGTAAGATGMDMRALERAINDVLARDKPRLLALIESALADRERTKF
jgi:TP901 family phage tail tape measure protein